MFRHLKSSSHCRLVFALLLVLLFCSVYFYLSRCRFLSHLPPRTPVSSSMLEAGLTASLRLFADSLAQGVLLTASRHS